MHTRTHARSPSFQTLQELASIDAKLGSMRSSKRGQLEEQAARLDERLDALSRERSELVGSPL
jgi:hypothetical protein